MRSRAAIAGLLLPLLACNKPRPHRAEATMEARSGSAATGTGVFVEVPEGVKVTIRVAGAAPGRHGIHLHWKGDCSAPDAESAGPHWNPDEAPHGAPGAPAHAGDL